MPRKKQPIRKKQATNEVRDLQKQVKKLQQAFAELDAQRLADIDIAAETGYELGLLEAEEKALRRAQVIAEAVVDFEKSCESKVISKATSKASVTKKTAKRRGRPAKVKKRGRKAKVAVPAEEPAVELPASPVPETGEVTIRG